MTFDTYFLTGPVHSTKPSTHSYTLVNSRHNHGTSEALLCARRGQEPSGCHVHGPRLCGFHTPANTHAPEPPNAHTHRHTSTNIGTAKYAHAHTQTHSSLISPTQVLVEQGNPRMGPLRPHARTQVCVNLPSHKGGLILLLRFRPHPTQPPQLEAALSPVNS